MSTRRPRSLWWGYAIAIACGAMIGIAARAQNHTPQMSCRTVQHGDLVFATISTGSRRSSKDDLIILQNRAQVCVTVTGSLRRIYHGRGGAVREKSVQRLRAMRLAPGQQWMWARKETMWARRADGVTTAAIGPQDTLIVRTDGGAVVLAVRLGDGPPVDGAVPVRAPQVTEYIAVHDGTYRVRKRCESALLRQAPCPRAHYPSLRISEVFANPPGRDRGAEWVELWNPTKETIVLTEGWRLADRSRTCALSGTIHAGAYYVLRNLCLTLNNDRETLTLLTPNDAVSDRMTYTQAPEGFSLIATAEGIAVAHPSPRAPSHALAALHGEADIPRRARKGVALRFRAKATTPAPPARIRWDFGDGHTSTRWTVRHTYKKSGTYTVTVTVRDAAQRRWQYSAPVRVRTAQWPRVRIVALLPNPPGRDRGVEWILLQNKGKRTAHLRDWRIAVRSKNGKTWRTAMLHKKVRVRRRHTVRLTAKHLALSLPNKGARIRLIAPDGRVVQTVRYTPPEGARDIPEGAVYRKRPKGEGGWRWEVPPHQSSSGIVAPRTTPPPQSPPPQPTVLQPQQASSRSTPKEAATPIVAVPSPQQPQGAAIHDPTCPSEAYCGAVVTPEPLPPMWVDPAVLALRVAGLVRTLPLQ